MKRSAFVTILAVILLIIAAMPVAQVAADSQRNVQLWVESGSAGAPYKPDDGWHSYLKTGVNSSVNGPYAPGEVIDVWAHPNPEGMVFDRWTGDTQLLQDIYAAHTWLTMPDVQVRIKATYRSAPEWTATFEVYNGTEVYYYFPTGFKAVVTLHHGAGGRSLSWVTRGEMRSFCKDLVANGYAIVAVESVNRTGKTWNLTTDPNLNPDINNVNNILLYLKGKGLFSDSTRLYGVGMSNGGQFISLLSYALGYKAQAIYGAPGVASYLARADYLIPTIWCPSERDAYSNTSATKTAFDALRLRLGDAGASLNILQPTPIYPLRFWRIAGFTASDSQEVFVMLKENGFLDERNYLTARPATSGWAAYLDPKFASNQKDISDQLYIAWTDHQFYSDYTARVVRFFDAH